MPRFAFGYTRIYSRKCEQARRRFQFVVIKNSYRFTHSFEPPQAPSETRLWSAGAEESAVLRSALFDATSGEKNSVLAN